MLPLYTRTLALAFVLAPAMAMAQVTIAPTALFIDSQSRFGTFLVINGSDAEQEVAVEFAFGYPDTDSLGTPFMNYADAAAAEQYSLAPWLRAFPRAFRLGPGERQVVRLNARPPADLPDGTYWTRVRTISNPASPPPETAVADGVTAQIGMRFEQVTAAFLRHGAVSTGVSIEDVTIGTEGDRARVLAEVARSGNSPFLGTMTVALLDQGGAKVREASTSVAIYRDSMRRVEVDVAGLPPGEYTAEISIEPRRADIPATDLLPGDPVTRRTTLVLL